MNTRSNYVNSGSGQRTYYTGSGQYIPGRYHFRRLDETSYNSESQNEDRKRKGEKRKERKKDTEELR